MDIAARRLASYESAFIRQGWTYRAGAPLPPPKRGLEHLLSIARVGRVEDNAGRNEAVDAIEHSGVERSLGGRKLAVKLADESRRRRRSGHRALRHTDCLMGTSHGLRIHHVDLAVDDVPRSLAFYLAVLGPLGLREWQRFPTYRGTEEVVYLSLGERDEFLGLRPADGGRHGYYEVGLEHLAFYVDSRAEVDAAYRRCCEVGARVQFPPEEDKDIEGFYEMFVFDPDGHRIEIACRPPLEDPQKPTLRARDDGTSS